MRPRPYVAKPAKFVMSGETVAARRHPSRRPRRSFPAGHRGPEFASADLVYSDANMLPDCAAPKGGRPNVSSVGDGSGAAERVGHSRREEPRHYPDHLDPRLLKLAGICVLAAVMTIVDATVVNVAQRTFVDQFHSTEAVVAWTMTGYTLALAAVIPLAGWAADRFGTKRLFLGSVALFTAGSLLCALAGSIGTLIAFRVVQGFGGGMVMPLVFTILTREAGPARLGRLTSLLGIPMLLGPVSGPILGGWLIEYYNWPWIFWINLPIGLIAVVLAAIVFDKDKPQPSESFDLIGMMLLSPGLASFLYAMSILPERGSVTDSHVWIPATIGVALVGGFVWHALYRTAHPLIDLRLFAQPAITASNVAMFFFAAAFFGAVLLLPSYFQQVFGHAPLQAGLHVIPEGLGAMLTMPFAGRITDRHGARGIVLAGVMLMCAGMGVFTGGVWNHADYAPMLLVGLLIFGTGMGCIMMPLSTAAVQTLRAEQVARGSTLINVSQRVAAAVGAAALAVILTNQLAHSSTITAANQLADLQKQASHTPVGSAAIPPAAVSPSFHDQLISDLSHAYARIFMIVYGVTALTCLPAAFLRKQPTDRSARRPQVGQEPTRT